jgi:large subunit ribosomal protein L30
MGMMLVVNLHGKINSSDAVRRALGELKVERKFTATLVPDDVDTMGMLKLCKDYIAWCPAEKGLLSELLEKRGMATESRRLDADALKGMGFKTHAELAERVLSGGARLTTMPGIRPFFRLSPPKKGFNASLRRQASEKGMLGSNSKLAETIRRMI